MPVLLGDELHRAGARVPDGFRRRHRCCGHFLSHGEARRRRLLEHLLVAPLHRAVALVKMQHVAVRIAEHLHLDVPRPLQVTLDEHALVAERCLCFPHRRLECGAKCFSLGDDAHALAAAARCRLDEHRQADASRLLLQQCGVLALAVVARHERHAGLLHQPLRRRLVAHRGDRLGRRADEHDPGALARRREVLVLSQEPVPGVDRLRARRLGGGQHGVDAEIALGRRRRPEAPRFVGKLHVQGVAVGIRIHRHRADAHALRGANHTAGYLAAVGDQDRAEHASASTRACASRGTTRRPLSPPAKRGSPRSAVRCRRATHRRSAGRQCRAPGP